MVTDKQRLGGFSYACWLCDTLVVAVLDHHKIQACLGGHHLSSSYHFRSPRMKASFLLKNKTSSMTSRG